MAPAHCSRAALWLALSVGLVGCAGAERPVHSATAADASSATAAPGLANAELRQSLLAPGQPQQAGLPAAEGGAAPATVTLITPPVARQAVLDAREAMQKKQWSRLEGLAPLAQADPVLGAYAEYWLLRQQLQDSSQPVPDARLQRFMAVNQDAYLADKLKADWIVAAARSGNYALVNRLGPVVNSNAHVECSRLLSQHMAGERVKSVQVMAAFQPNRACWSMLDQMESSKVVGWKELEPLLRATLETNKTDDAQRLAAVMFDTTDMVAYAALMKNPKKWLAGRKPPRSRADIELVTIALSRLAYGKERSENAAYVESAWSKAIP
ncbi:MAG: lytic transglycosylase domain-containing protein, partial [Pollutimonas bauzanensis]